MTDNYDPLPDLAELVRAAFGYNTTDANYYAERIAEHLGLVEFEDNEDGRPCPLVAGTVAAELRKALGLKACRCAIGGPAEVLPLACPVHGTPCGECGGLENCTGNCGGEEGAAAAEPCTAKSAVLGRACGQPATGLYAGTCPRGHVAERHLCAGHAEPEEPLWCQACHVLDGRVRPVALKPAAARAAGTEGQ